MPRQAEIYTKKVKGHEYWCKYINGRVRSLGNKQSVSFQQAQLIAANLALKVPQKVVSGRAVNFSCYELFDNYLEWQLRNNSEGRSKNVKLFLGQFAAFKPDGKKKPVGTMKAIDVTAEMVEEFLDVRAADGLEGNAIWALLTTIKSCWNWGAGNDKGQGGDFLPEGHRPFRKVKRKKPEPCLRDTDLPTEDEINQILHEAKFRKGFRDFVRFIYLTGARPIEVCRMNVGDYQKGMVLFEADRAKQGKQRCVYLQDEAKKIVLSRLADKGAEDPVFVGAQGARWTTGRAGKILYQLKESLDVRDHVTLYSFRHLYITTALKSEVPIVDVAHMCGTSTKMIEKHYAHFIGAKKMFDNADRIGRAMPQLGKKATPENATSS